MLFLWNRHFQVDRTRGATSVLKLAAFAAILPYLFGALSRLEPTYAPALIVISICITLTLTIAIRTALADMFGVPERLLPLREGPDVRIASADSTNTAAPLLTALSGTHEMIARLENYNAEAGPVTIGIIRFANYSPMVAYHAVGAADVMSVFRQRMTDATGRKFVAQIGDETFGVWIDGHEEDAAGQLQSLAYVLSQDLVAKHLTVLPEIHIGLASYPADGQSAKSVISHGIGLCVPLKAFVAPSGSDIASPERDPAYRFAMEQALRRAAREGELSLRYQPLIDAAAGKVVGAEVLLRWKHPAFGDVSPSVFVPILERTGLIHEIGLWTLNSACRQLRQWRATGHPDIKLAINLSAVQLQDAALKTSITRIVDSHGLVPMDVELELTETAAMEDREATIALFRELRMLGFGIALDDFGSGHSNFGYLRSLPITKLKIDREFISHIETCAGSQAICKSLVELGSGLGIAILAEGVERLEEVETLRRLGCHLFQGYYFERPQTAADFTAKLSDPDWYINVASDVHRMRAEVKRRMLS